MKKSLLITSTFLLGISGFAMAGSLPSFSEADLDNDGTLNAQELATALPELNLEQLNPTATVTTADIQRLMPEIEFSGDVEVSGDTPIGEKQYQQIVDALAEQAENNTVSSI